MRKVLFRMITSIIIVILMSINIGGDIVVFARSDDFNEYDLIREKYYNYICGGKELDINDTVIANKIQKLNGPAEHNWQTMNDAKVWDDLLDSSLKSPLLIYKRILPMAKAYATLGTKLYHDKDLLHDIIDALEWTYENRYNENIKQCGNWWNWVIGAPNNLLKTIVLLYDELTQEQIEKYCRAINKFCPGPMRPGANGADESFITVIKGALIEDSSEIVKGRNGINDIFKYVTEGDGMYEDGSYIFHRKIPYNLHYGISPTSSSINILCLLNDTRWENNNINNISIIDWVEKAYCPFLIDGKLVLPLTGRFSASNNNNRLFGPEFNNLLCCISMVSQTCENADFLKSFIKYNVLKCGEEKFYNSVSLYNYMQVKKIVNNKNIMPLDVKNGNYHLYNSDIMAHKRDGWYFINKMYSTRLYPYEVTNKMNRKAWYKSDGVTYIYVNPKDYINNWMWGIDYHRMPGITVDRWIERPEAEGGTCWGQQGFESEKDFVGGVSLDEKYGLSVMDFKQHHVDVTPKMDVEAKKSWFMFDNEVVALGAGINSTSGRDIETVVDNRALNFENNEIFKVNGNINNSKKEWTQAINNTNWVYLQDFGGYYFPKPVTLDVIRERRAEDPINISSSTSTDMFDGKALSNAWKWLNDKKNYRYTDDGKLILSTSKGTLKNNENLTKNLLIKSIPNPNYDFELTTCLEGFTPKEVRQEAGLIIYIDKDDYIYISRAYTEEGNKLVIAKEINGDYTEQLFEDNLQSNIQFKIEKLNNNFKLYAKNDKDEWSKQLVTINKPFSDDKISMIKIGLFAQSGDNKTSEIDAVFDYIQHRQSGNFITMWLDHGINPTDSTYEYVLLPTMTENDIRKYVKNPEVTIIKNTKDLQVVKENKKNIIGIVNWNECGNTIDKYKLNNKSCMLIEEKNSYYNIAVSDPSQLRDTISFEINDSVDNIIKCDSEITVTQLSPTIKFKVNMKNSHGKSFSLKIKK